MWRFGFVIKVVLEIVEFVESVLREICLCVWSLSKSVLKIYVCVLVWESIMRIVYSNYFIDGLCVFIIISLLCFGMLLAYLHYL